jgi:hypothetical protein
MRNKQFYNAEATLLKTVNSDFTDHSVAFRVRRFYTDVLGQLVDKTLVPASLQVSYPFSVLGEFDRVGGYKQALLSATPPTIDTYYLGCFINGTGINSFSFTGFSGLNQIQGNLLTGDIVQVYTDSLVSPTYFIWIVQQSAIVSLGSIVANTKSTQKDDKFNRLYVKSMIYTTSNQNEDQWNEAIHTTRLNNIGLAKDDTIMPTIWKTPYTYQTGILEIGLNFWVDQYLGLNTYIRYGTEDIQFILKLNK